MVFGPAGRTGLHSAQPRPTGTPCRQVAGGSVGFRPRLGRVVVSVRWRMGLLPGDVGWVGQGPWLELALRSGAAYVLLELSFFWVGSGHVGGGSSPLPH